MMNPPVSRNTPSGYAELHVVSTTLAAQADKAIVSCASLCAAYPEIARFQLLTDQPAGARWAGLSALPRAQMLGENEVYAKSAWLARFTAMEHLSPKRALWYYQQVLKLAKLFTLAAELAGRPDADQIGILIWDADTRIVQPIPLLDARSGRSLSYVTGNLQERHEPFYLVNARLAGLPPSIRQPHSNIVQFAALSVPETMAFAKFLGLDANTPDCVDHLAERIVDVILAVGLTNAALFSEYELIGLFKQEVLGSRLQRVRFIRVNRRTVSPAQLRIMRLCGIVHFTCEEWFGEPAPMSQMLLLAHLVQQHVPAVQRLKRLLSLVRA